MQPGGPGVWSTSECSQETNEFLPIQRRILTVLRPCGCGVDDAIHFADIHHMLEFERQELMENTDWRTVLTAYRERRDTAKANDPEFEGWLDRVMAIDGIEEDDLPRLHGKLLALGFLKFQLAGRSEGVRYQITGEGVKALENLTGPVADEELDVEEPDVGELDEEESETAPEVSATILKFAS